MIIPYSKNKITKKTITVKTVSNIKWLFINNDNMILSIADLPLLQNCRTYRKQVMFGRYHSREPWEDNFKKNLMEDNLDNERRPQNGRRPTFFCK